MLCSSTSAADGLVGAGAVFNGATSSWVVISSTPWSAAYFSRSAFASSTSVVAGATNPLRSPHATCGRATLFELMLGVTSVLQVPKAGDLLSTVLHPAQQKALP